MLEFFVAAESLVCTLDIEKIVRVQRRASDDERTAMTMTTTGRRDEDERDLQNVHAAGKGYPSVHLWEEISCRADPLSFYGTSALGLTPGA